MAFRTPPKKTIRIACSSCRKELESLFVNVVACTICSSWYHMTCVGLTSTKTHGTWKCTKCETDYECESPCEICKNPITAQEVKVKCVRAPCMAYCHQACDRTNDWKCVNCTFNDNESVTIENPNCNVCNLEISKLNFGYECGKCKLTFHDLCKLQQQHEAECEVHEPSTNVSELHEKMASLEEKISEYEEVLEKFLKRDEEREKKFLSQEQKLLKQEEQNQLLREALKRQQDSNRRQLTEPVYASQQRSQGGILDQALSRLNHVSISAPRVTGTIHRDSSVFNGSRLNDPNTLFNSTGVGGVNASVSASANIYYPALTQAEKDSRKLRDTLPKLPVFTGNVLEWGEFELIYDDTTSIGQYRDYENFARLKDKIKGDALLEIKTLFASRSSAETIMNFLRKRYGGSGPVLRNLNHQLKSFKKLESIMDPRTIQFSSLVQSYVDSASRTNCPSSLNLSFLIDEYSEKLCDINQREWMKEKQRIIQAGLKPEPDMIDFANFLIGLANEIPIQLKKRSEAANGVKEKHIHVHEVENINA